MLTASWDATVKVWGVRIMEGEKIHIEKDPVVEFFDADTSIDSLDAIAILDLGIAVAAGGTDGSLIVWLWRFDGSKEVIFREESAKRGVSCSALKWSHWPNGDYVLFAGYRNCSLNSYIYKKTGMIATSKLNVGSPVQCLDVVAHTTDIFVGCRDGEVRLVSVEDGVRFEKDPWLFGPGNCEGSSTSAVTSISVSCVNGRSPKYTVALGMEDGKTCLFSIRK